MKKKLGAILLVVALAVTLGLVPAASVGASPGPGIVGLWHFDGDANDDSGNSYNGTLHGDAMYVDIESEMPGFDRALSLDGNGDYVEVAHAIAVTSAITMEAWVKVDAPISADAEVISKWDGSGNGVIHFEIAPDLTVRMCLRWGAGINDYIVNFYSTEALPGNQWVHVAEVWDGTTATIYFDGVAKGSQSGSGTIRHNSSMKYWIGSAYGTMRFFDGLIDEVRIWDEALSASQLGDVSAPVVTITAPEDGAFYLVGMVPTGAYTVTDNLDPSPTVVESGWFDTGGEHTYTVTATDCAGNVGDASVTYYVIDNKYATIGGQIEEGTGKKKDNLRISFGGWVGLDGGYHGEVEVTFHNVGPDEPLNKLKFVSTSITNIKFPDDATSTDPAAPPPTDKNKVKFWATGDLWDGTSIVEHNCQLIVRANDCGEPAKKGEVDNIRIDLNCTDTTYNYDTHFDGDWEEPIDYRTPIDAGNIQVVYVVE